MTQTNTEITGIIKMISLMKAMFIGAGIGLLVILLFITDSVTQPHWPTFWKIRPLIFTPLTGAFGGGLAYLASKVLYRRGVNGATANFISLPGFLIALWLGVVLGLDGTLWD